MEPKEMNKERDSEGSLEMLQAFFQMGCIIYTVTTPLFFFRHQTQKWIANTTLADWVSPCIPFFLLGPSGFFFGPFM